MIKAKEMRGRVPIIPMLVQNMMYAAAKDGFYSTELPGEWDVAMIFELEQLGYIVTVCSKKFENNISDDNFDSVTISWEPNNLYVGGKIFKDF